MRMTITTALLLAISGSACAQTVERIEILEYGIFAAKIEEKKEDAKAVGDTRVLLSAVRLVEATTTVPARQGVEFGFRYKIHGTPHGAPVQLRKVILIPPPGLQNPNTGKTKVRGEFSFTETIGETRYRGYHFDDPWELVPGNWTMELWRGDRKLASQSFNVVKP